MATSYQIRDATPEDVEAIVELCAAHAAYERATYHRSGKEPVLRDLLFEDPPRLHGLVVDDGSDVVGYATYAVQWSTWNAAPYLYMDGLYLDAAVRGQGIGAELVQRVVAEARTRGCQAVEWQTPVFNTRAMRFYERLGAIGAKKVRYRFVVDSPS